MQPLVAAFGDARRLQFADRERQQFQKARPARKRGAPLKMDKYESFPYPRKESEHSGTKKLCADLNRPPAGNVSTGAINCKQTGRYSINVITAQKMRTLLESV